MVRKYGSIFLALLIVTLIVGCSTQSATQSKKDSKYPERAIEVIVPFNAGGGSDLTVRTFAPFLEKELGVSLAIINKPGAGGIMGMTAVSKAKPDGYTIGLTGLPGLPALAITGDFTVDPIKNFDYLGAIVSDPAVIAVSAKSEYKTLGEVIDHLKKNPESLSYAATGSAGLDAITAYGLENATSAKFRMVNFESGKEAITSVLGGNIDAVGLAVSEASPYLKSGDLRVLGVAGEKRVPSMPDVPTFSEQGIKLSKGFDTATKSGIVRGFFMPAGADEQVLATLRDAVKKAAENPEFKAQAEKIGLPVSYVESDVFAKSVETMIKELKIPIQK